LSQGATEQAASAEEVSASVEEMNATIRQNAERTVIPGLFVSHVVELPFSAHPTSVYRTYDYDGGQLQAYVEATRTPETFRAYLDQYVYGVKDHWEYLERIGGLAHLSSLQADPVLGY